MNDFDFSALDDAVAARNESSGACPHLAQAPEGCTPEERQRSYALARECRDRARTAPSSVCGQPDTTKGWAEYRKRRQGCIRRAVATRNPRMFLK